MDLVERVVCLDVLTLDVGGVETEDAGFLGVHPDDGVIVGHSVSIVLPEGASSRLSGCKLIK